MGPVTVVMYVITWTVAFIRDGLRGVWPWSDYYDYDSTR